MGGCVTEEWLAVAGYEGYYEVSSLGMVRGCDRWIKGRGSVLRLWKGRPLKPYTPSDANCGNYIQVTLAKDGKTQTKDVHRLMAIAFLPNPENKPEVNHKDGDKLNNALSNLEWLTYREHKLYGIYVQGVVTNRKLSAEDVLSIKLMLKKGLTQAEIAETFGVTQSNISRIKLGQFWRSVETGDEE